MDEQLIDKIHESSFVPELWPGVLDEIACIADARGGKLLAPSDEGLRWTASACLEELVTAYVTQGWWPAHGERRARLAATRHPGFLGDHKLFTAEERESEPIYCGLLRPRGLGWAAATAIPLPAGNMVVISLERDYARGPVEDAVIQQLDQLRPHLARSALVSVRLQLERARAASETLALLGLPALVLDNQGKILAANHLIEALTGFVRWQAWDRVALKDAGAHILFQRAAATLDSGNTAVVRSFVIRAAETGAPMVAHLVPIRGSARDIFVRCAGVLVMTPVARPQAPPTELVQSLFDLTPAEARVARGLAEGETVEELASTGGVSRNTVRSQLYSVMEKTGCNRQAEVVALLAGITAPQPDARRWRE